MDGSGPCSRAMALFLALVMAAGALHPGPARAAMITTGQVIENLAADDPRARVSAFMARDDVRRQLGALGIDPAEALDRAASLSDAEIREVAGRLDRVAAGQSAGLAIAGAIFFIFIVLLITDLLGLTDVYPFVKSLKTE